MSDEEALEFVRWAEKTHPAYLNNLKDGYRPIQEHFTMTFIVECHSEATGWLPYARADNIEEARMKAANAFIKTRHTVVRITEERR